MARPKKMSLTMQIMIGMVAGALLGIFFNALAAESGLVQEWFVDGIFHVIGSIFVASLKMLVVPLVFISLVVGVTSLGDSAAFGRIASKTIAIYLCTTAIAISIAMTLALAIAPGAGLALDTSAAQFQAKEPPALSEVIINMVPTNPIKSMAEGNMLQIIVFAMLFGSAINLAGDRGKQLQNTFQNLDAVVMKVVELVMKLAPVGVFCLIAKTFTTQGLDIILPLISYFGTVSLALILHATGTFSILLQVFTRLSPWTFFKKMGSNMVFAFSTSSSNATIPVTLNTAEKKLGVKESIAAFTVPLGATINMDGTAIMQGVATVFIANVYNVALSTSDLLSVVLTATLASIGAAGVPGVGLVMLTLVLTQVGLPVEGIALIIGVDRLLDMMRTVVNITGDATVTCIVANSENAIDRDCFYADPEEQEEHLGEADA